MKTDFKKFTQHVFKSFKGAIFGLLFVPFFYLVLNLNQSRDVLLRGLLISIRIGFIVLLTSVFVSGSIHFFLRNNIVLAQKLRRSMVFRMTFGVAGMLLGLTLASCIESAFFNNHFGWQGISIGLVIGSATYCVILYRAVLRETQEYNLQLRAESAEANMNTLKNQMQPHFLFNSLNSLAELIDSNREHASTMTQKLSDLYREILEASKLPKSTLQNELAIVEKYLALESLRFGARLHYEIQKPVNPENILLPSLILQTLVENAVKHGISQSLQGGQITVQVTAASEGYWLQILNPQADDLKLPASSTGTGLANTKARLDLMYGDRHQFELKNKNGQTHVQFWITGY